jgi:ABC-2 type transport system permease protein
MITLIHTWYITLRHLRRVTRQPWVIALMLVQPAIWLVFYGQLFKKVIEMPGFQADSYIAFLSPGIAVMSALFLAGWSGTGVIEDLNRGVMDRFLVSPVSRSALIAGKLIPLAGVTLFQSLVIVLLSVLLGARFPNAALGVPVLTTCAVLLAGSVGALSSGFALLVRKQEILAALINFALLPLTFLSSTFMARTLMPHWIQVATRFNPVDWAVEASREALEGRANWERILIRACCLFVLLIVSTSLAVRAFRIYQRSL